MGQNEILKDIVDVRENIKEVWERIGIVQATGYPNKLTGGHYDFFCFFCPLPLNLSCPLPLAQLFLPTPHLSTLPSSHHSPSHSLTYLPSPTLTTLPIHPKPSLLLYTSSFHLLPTHFAFPHFSPSPTPTPLSPSSHHPPLHLPTSHLPITTPLFPHSSSLPITTPLHSTISIPSHHPHTPPSPRR